eukprot:gene7099-9686_t
MDDKNNDEQFRSADSLDSSANALVDIDLNDDTNHKDGDIVKGVEPTVHVASTINGNEIHDEVISISIPPQVQSEFPQHSLSASPTQFCYGDIVWTQADSHFPFWPAYVFDPAKLPLSLKYSSIAIQKKKAVYFYGRNDYDFVQYSNMREYSKHRKEFKAQSMNSSLATLFAKAIKLADEELLKPVEKRVSWLLSSNSDIQKSRLGTGDNARSSRRGKDRHSPPKPLIVNEDGADLLKYENKAGILSNGSFMNESNQSSLAGSPIAINSDQNKSLFQISTSEFDMKMKISEVISSTVSVNPNHSNHVNNNSTSEVQLGFTSTNDCTTTDSIQSIETVIVSASEPVNTVRNVDSKSESDALFGIASADNISTAMQPDDINLNQIIEKIPIEVSYLAHHAVTPTLDGNNVINETIPSSIPPSVVQSIAEQIENKPLEVNSHSSSMSSSVAVLTNEALDDFVGSNAPKMRNHNQKVNNSMSSVSSDFFNHIDQSSDSLAFNRTISTSPVNANKFSQPAQQTLEIQLPSNQKQLFGSTNKPVSSPLVKKVVAKISNAELFGASTSNAQLSEFDKVVEVKSKNYPRDDKKPVVNMTADLFSSLPPSSNNMFDVPVQKNDIPPPPLFTSNKREVSDTTIKNISIPATTSNKSLSDAASLFNSSLPNNNTTTNNTLVFDEIPADNKWIPNPSIHPTENDFFSNNQHSSSSAFPAICSISSNPIEGNENNNIYKETPKLSETASFYDSKNSILSFENNNQITEEHKEPQTNNFAIPPLDIIGNKIMEKNTFSDLSTLTSSARDNTNSNALSVNEEEKSPQSFPFQNPSLSLAKPTAVTRQASGGVVFQGKAPIIEGASPFDSVAPSGFNSSTSNRSGQGKSTFIAGAASDLFAKSPPFPTNNNTSNGFQSDNDLFSSPPPGTKSQKIAPTASATDIFNQLPPSNIPSIPSDPFSPPAAPGVKVIPPPKKKIDDNTNNLPTGVPSIPIASVPSKEINTTKAKNAINRAKNSGPPADSIPPGMRLTPHGLAVTPATTVNAAPPSAVSFPVPPSNNTAASLFSSANDNANRLFAAPPTTIASVKTSDAIIDNSILSTLTQVPETVPFDMNKVNDDYQPVPPPQPIVAPEKDSIAVFGRKNHDGMTITPLLQQQRMNNHCIGKPVCTIVSFGFGGKVAIMFPKATSLLHSNPLLSMKDAKPYAAGCIRQVRLLDLIHVGSQQNDLGVRVTVNSLPDLHQLVSAAQAFSGPLGASSDWNAEESQIRNYIAEELQNCSQLSRNNDQILLWKLILILLDSNGTLSSDLGSSDPSSPESRIIQLLLDHSSDGPAEESLLSSLHQSFASNSTNNNTNKTSPEVILEIEKLLVRGQREEALQIAMRERDWSLAMLISCVCGPDKYQEVVKSFANNHFPLGSPIHLLAMSYSNQASKSLLYSGGEISKQFKSPFEMALNQSNMNKANNHESAQTSQPQGNGQGGTGAGSNGDIISFWKQNLAALLANKGSDWKKLIRILGFRLLNESKNICAAHFAYLCCSLTPSHPQSFGKQASANMNSLDENFVLSRMGKFTLLGCDLSLKYHKLVSDSTSVTALRMSEIVEWSIKRQIAVKSSGPSHASGGIASIGKSMFNMFGWSNSNNNSVNTNNATMASVNNNMDGLSEGLLKTRAVLCSFKIRFAIFIADLGLINEALQYVREAKALQLELIGLEQAASVKSKAPSAINAGKDAVIKPLSKAFMEDLEVLLDRMTVTLSLTSPIHANNNNSSSINNNQNNNSTVGNTAIMSKEQANLYTNNNQSNPNNNNLFNNIIHTISSSVNLQEIIDGPTTATATSNPSFLPPPSMYDNSPMPMQPIQNQPSLDPSSNNNNYDNNYSNTYNNNPMNNNNSNSNPPYMYGHAYPHNNINNNVNDMSSGYPPFYSNTSNNSNYQSNQHNNNSSSTPPTPNNYYPSNPTPHAPAPSTSYYDKPNVFNPNPSSMSSAPLPYQQTSSSSSFIQSNYPTYPTTTTNNNNINNNANNNSQANSSFNSRASSSNNLNVSDHNNPKKPPSPAVSEPSVANNTATPPATGGLLSNFKSFLVQKIYPDAKQVSEDNMGKSMEAYYDDKLQRWVFPGEENAAASNPASAPPPIMAPSQPMTSIAPPTMNNNNDNNNSAAYDPLAALMAPPPRRPPTSVMGMVGNTSGMPSNDFNPSMNMNPSGPPPSINIWKPPTNSTT